VRLLQITAARGGMYCGSCLRDNALAAELRRRGEDVMLLPVYTPTLTDEANVSEGRVLFGRNQRLPRAARAAPPNGRRPCSTRLWDAAAVIKAATGPAVSRWIPMASGPHRLDPEGRGGSPGQGVPQAGPLPRRPAAFRSRRASELAPHQHGGHAQARLSLGRSCARSRARISSSTVSASPTARRRRISSCSTRAPSTASPPRARTTPTSWRSASASHARRSTLCRSASLWRAMGPR